MAAALLPGYLWAEILQATNLLRNMAPVSNLTCTPFEKWTGVKPDLSKLPTAANINVLRSNLVRRCITSSMY